MIDELTRAALNWNSLKTVLQKAIDDRRMMLEYCTNRQTVITEIRTLQDVQELMSFLEQKSKEADERAAPG